MEEEIWKSCSDNKLYSVSNLGRFKNSAGKINKRKAHSSGYIRVYLPKVGMKPLHVLVAKEFILNPDPDTKIIVNHIDGNKANNKVSNLEWVTYSENNTKVVSRLKPKHNIYKHSNLENEEWKDVDFEGIKMKASTLGRVELPTGYKTFGNSTADGYLSVFLKKDGKKFMRLVHRIVCTAFHGIHNGEASLVNHKDYNKKNNKPENLEWLTNGENVIHGKANKPKTIAHNRQRLCQYTPEKGKLIAVYDNITQASIESGANRSGIVQMCRKWRGNNYKTVGGFYWEYE